MKKQPKNSSNDPLTKEDFTSFLKNPENQELQERIEGDPFAREALEGFASNPEALADLESMEKRFSRSSSKGSVWNIIKPVLLILAGATSTYILVTITKEEEQTKESLQITSTISNSNPSLDPTIESNDSIELVAIENSSPIPEEKQITYKKYIEEQPTTILEANEEEQEVTTYNTIEIVQEKTIQQEKPANLVARSNVKFKYIEDLKVVDYSGLYSSPIKKTEIDLAETPANMENENSQRPDPVFKTVLIPYEQFLQENLLLFKSGNFKSALKNFIVILDQYPDDLNAFFYGGLCYYNIGKNGKAIEWFDRCIHNSYSTFEEEAVWYKALCLIEGRSFQKNEGKNLLHEIVEKNGFYAKRAKEKLKDLN